MKILLSWLREFVDVPGTADEIAATMSVRGFAVEGIEPLGERCGDRLRSDRQSARLHVGDRHGARSRHRLRPAGATSGDARARAGARAQGRAGRSASRRTLMPTVDDRTSRQRLERRLPGIHLISLKTVEQVDVAVTIENPDLCPRYVAAVADVTVGDVAGMDAVAPAGRRRPPDQQHRRRHQLRAARARSADARVRQGAAGRRPDPRAHGARRRNHPDTRRSAADARRRTCW